MHEPNCFIKVPSRPEDSENWKRVIVVLDGCALGEHIRHHDSIKNHKSPFESSYKTKGDQRVMKKMPEHRIDILHQCLLQLLESPLCMAGFLEIFLSTQCGTLIRVDPRFECPIYFDDFLAIVDDLLLTRRVKAKTEHGGKKRVPVNLLQIVKNPLDAHLPSSQMKSITIFNMSEAADEVKIDNIIQKLFENLPASPGGSTCNSQLHMSPLFVIGAFKTGTIDLCRWKKMNINYGACMQEVRIEKSELSAGRCCAMLAREFEVSLGLQ